MDAPGAMEDMSTSSAFLSAFSSTPPSPSTAAFTWGLLGSMVMTMGQPRTASAMLAQPIAPLSATALTEASTMS